MSPRADSSSPRRSSTTAAARSPCTCRRIRSRRSCSPVTVGGTSRGWAVPSTRRQRGPRWSSASMDCPRVNGQRLRHLETRSKRRALGSGFPAGVGDSASPARPVGSPGGGGRSQCRPLLGSTASVRPAGRARPQRRSARSAAGPTIDVPDPKLQSRSVVRRLSPARATPKWACVPPSARSSSTARIVSSPQAAVETGRVAW